jgi:hypothetical protein
MLNSSQYRTVPIDDADALLAYAKHLPETHRPNWWMFRGTTRPFPLMTSLERALRDAGVPLSDAPAIEQQMLKEFKRRAHFYLNVLPPEGDILGWLALMQHHGGPTRLLDWTYSFFVAAFFALSDAVSFPDERRERAVVWALYRDAFKLAPQAPQARMAVSRAIDGHSWKEDVGRSDGDYLYDGVNAYLISTMESPELSVWAINPFRLNERLSVQKGVFLCPGHVGVPFEDNLLDNTVSPMNLIRFELSTVPGARREMLEALAAMNIGSTSLFPGLDGFARSLRQTAWLGYRLRPTTPSHFE